MKQPRLSFIRFCTYLFLGMLAQVFIIKPLAATDFDQQKTITVLQQNVAAEIVITGKVVDENGQGLPGTTVSIKGKTTGVAADMNGNFSISVDESDTLVFSFVGYTPLEESTAGRTVINVSLTPETTRLEEVVVTGYQTLSKERVTGSFETIPNEVLEQRPVNNFVNKLEGIASGVNVTNGRVEVRGKSTIKGNATPLYVVDGFPLAGSTLTVNPEDIESITVLKDAAAASIWGVRASNGVIVVTTKKGSREGTKINFSTFIDIGEGVDYSKQNWLSTADEIDLQQEYFDKGWYKGLPGEIGLFYAFDQLEIANIYRMGLSPDGEIWSEATYNDFVDNLKKKDITKQWEDLMTQNPVRQTYNLTVASGGEHNDIYASLVYNNNLSRTKGDADDRIVLNIKDEFRLKDHFIFNAGVNASMRNNTMNGIDPSTVRNIRAYEPLVDDYGRPIQYYRNYSPWKSREREAIPGNFPYSYNPLDQRNNLDWTQQQIDVRTQFGIGLIIIEGMRFDTRFQYEAGTTDRDDFNTMDLPTQRIMINNYYRPGEFDEDGGEIGYLVPVGTKYTYSRNGYHAWDWRNTLSFEKAWSTHHITVFGGAEVRKHASENLRATLYGYNRQTTNYIPVNENDFRAGLLSGWNKNPLRTGAFSVLSDNDIREASFFGNAGYTFNGKYSLTGSFRVDQKNLFGSDPRFRYKPLWSTGVRWQISEEKFMRGIDFLDRLTLRVTYGISGNATNKYSPYAQAVPMIRSWGTKLFEFLSLNHPANDKLKWEETATFNVGFDFAIFNNKLGGTVEFYDKNSTDLLGDRPLDPTNGFAQAIVNYASMNNKGVDVTLRGNLIQRNGWNWDTKLLFSYNKNRVTDVVNETIVPVWLAYQGALRVGQPLDNIYSFDYAGLSAGGDVMINTAEGGVVNWRDYKGTEKEEDLIYYGTKKAPVYGGLTTTVTYKGFDLTLNLSYKFGYHFKHYYSAGVDSYYNATAEGGNGEIRMSDVWKNRWKKPGDELTTRIPKISYDGVNPYTGVLEFWWDSYDADWYWLDSQDNILDGGFVKVRDIIMGYTIPGEILSNTPVKSIRANVQVTNPYHWFANDRGIDPEHKYSMAWASGSLKAITFGLRASF